MNRLFKFLLPFLLIYGISTALGGPTQPLNNEVVSNSVSKAVEIQPQSPQTNNNKIFALLLLAGSASLFIGTYRIAGGIKKSHFATLYLAKIYLSQKDVLWKS
ncbi:MAG: hypothetical protein MRZ79_05790 [Bacteroidia bacterium]|nr:hypothetical protein [Bacteroidia bacterium]